MSEIYNPSTIDFLVRDKLECFYEQSFEKFDGGEKYLDNWYIGLLCEYLQAFANGEIRKLNINIPPRFGKSALCNVAFSMWYLGLNPEKRIISISHSASLSQKLHSFGRAISNSSWFHRAFPKFHIDTKSRTLKIDQSETKNTQNAFVTSKGGFRLATSAMGSITGEGANIIIFDDLMDPRQSMSVVESESILEWTKTTAFSRFNNRKKGQILNIQQRLGATDFTATFVDDSWENVIIPIKARRSKIYSFNNFLHVNKAGSYLEPRRYGDKELEEDRYLMGTKALEAQFFQNPYPDDGEIFRREWFRYYQFLPKMDYLAIYADTASKEGRNNDYTVFMCWGLLTKNQRKYAYLIDVFRNKMTTPKLLRAAKDFWLKHQSNEHDSPLIKFAVEDKSSGIGLIQLLEDETNIPVTKLYPEKDKVARANDILPRMESHQVLFPKDASWLGALEKELLTFSAKKGANKKDQVDTLTYAIKDLLFDPADQRLKPMNYSALLKETSILNRL